jgi:hypothetical protein
MGEPKPLASLSSSLLARKGQAKPAMRPQGFASFGFGGSNAHDDLGWNDMGNEPSAEPQPISSDVVPMLVGVPVEPPPVVRQQEELAREMSPAAVLSPELAALSAKMVRAAPGSKGKAAFTLRLDPERHLQLRLVCAVAHRSAQSLVIAALDAFLSTQPAVADLARTAKSTSSEQ